MLWPIMQEGGEDPVETLAAQLKEARKELTTTKINHEAQARLFVCFGFLFVRLRACAQGVHGVPVGRWCIAWRRGQMLVDCS